MNNVVTYLVEYSSREKGLVISGDAIGMVHFREKDLKRKAAHRVWVYAVHTYRTVHFGCLVEVRFAVFYM